MMEPTFEKLLVLLAEAGIRFIVVGGIAVSLQGYVRLTEDVDLLVERSQENLELLLATLSNYGEGFASELTIEDFTEEEGAIRIVEEVEFCQIDLFTVMSGFHYEDIVVDADHLVMGQSRIQYASKASLIRWKSKSVREKDQLDASALKRLCENPNTFK